MKNFQAGKSEKLLLNVGVKLKKLYFFLFRKNYRHILEKEIVILTIMPIT